MALQQRVKLLEQALQQSARLRQQFNDAQRALRESRSRYHSLIQNAFDAIFIVEKNGNIREANPTACELFSITVQELIGMNIIQLIPDLEAKVMANKKEHHIYEREGFRKD